MVKLALIKSRQVHPELPQSHTMDINEKKKIDREREDENKKSIFLINDNSTIAIDCKKQAKKGTKE